MSPIYECLKQGSDLTLLVQIRYRTATEPLKHIFSSIFLFIFSFIQLLVYFLSIPSLSPVCKGQKLQIH